MSRDLCLFDLDDTLLPLDSDHAWGDFVTRIGWVDAVVLRRRNAAFYAQYQAGQPGRGERCARALHAGGDRAQPATGGA